MLTTRSPLPQRLRRVVLADPADPNWTATQTVPAVSICADVATSERIGVMYVPHDAGGAVTSGTCDLQLVDVATSIARPEISAPVETLIKGSPVDTAVAIGEGLEFDVAASRIVTVRLVSSAALGGTTTTVDIYLNTLD